MTRYYKIVEGEGASGHLCPPGHYNHRYSLYEYNSPRSRSETGIGNLDQLRRPEADALPIVLAQAKKIFAATELIESEAWIRSVYGYFKSRYAPKSGTRDVSKAVSDPTNSISPERHLAVLCIREYFPDHEPRIDLIMNPGKGYGAWPCLKCGEQVQYEEKFDKHVKVTTRIIPGEGTLWTYGQECPKGGDHVVEEYTAPERAS